MHSTNYFNTFIAAAPDGPDVAGAVPPLRSERSVAERMYRLIKDHPYEYTSDEVIFTVWADRNGVAQKDRAKARKVFFAKPQPCLRASDLCKRYGWGIHSDATGRVALTAVDTPKYRALARGADGVAIKIAMRTTRK